MCGLKEWYKGTCGGLGLSTEFEGWSNAKLDRHNVDLDMYDHSDIKSRPVVLINRYGKQYAPHLTIVLHL